MLSQSWKSDSALKILTKNPISPFNGTNNKLGSTIVKREVDDIHEHAFDQIHNEANDMNDDLNDDPENLDNENGDVISKYSGNANGHYC